VFSIKNKKPVTCKCIDDVVFDLYMNKESGDTLWQIKLIPQAYMPITCQQHS